MVTTPPCSTAQEKQIIEEDRTIDMWRARGVTYPTLVTVEEYRSRQLRMEILQVGSAGALERFISSPLPFPPAFSAAHPPPTPPTAHSAHSAHIAHNHSGRGHIGRSGSGEAGMAYSLPLSIGKTAEGKKHPPTAAPPTAEPDIASTITMQPMSTPIPIPMSIPDTDDPPPPHGSLFRDTMHDSMLMSDRNNECAPAPFLFMNMSSVGSYFSKGVTPDDCLDTTVPPIRSIQRAGMVCKYCHGEGEVVMCCVCESPYHPNCVMSAHYVTEAQAPPHCAECEREALSFLAVTWPGERKRPDIQMTEAQNSLPKSKSHEFCVTPSPMDEEARSFVSSFFSPSMPMHTYPSPSKTN